MDAMFNLPRMHLTADELPGTPTTLQVCTPALNHAHSCSLPPCPLLQRANKQMNVLLDGCMNDSMDEHVDEQVSDYTNDRRNE